jgi:hypothetical protein
MDAPTDRHIALDQLPANPNAAGEAQRLGERPE